MRWFRVIAIACAACCVVALVAVYLPWHGFNRTTWNMCWAPDCDGISSDTTAGSDTGFSHTGIAPIVIYALAAAVALGASLVPRRSVRLFVGIATTTLVVVAEAVILKMTFLAHMFDKVHSLFGQALSGLATLSALMLAVALIAVRDPRPATAAAPGRSAGYPPPSPRSPGS